MASRLSDTELHGVSNPSVALHLSQQAPSFLRSEQSSSTQFPWSLLSAPETSDSWGTYERVLLACLKTGDEKSAHLCLERLTDRFGSTNERIMGLRGLYQEAVTEDDTGLEVILQEYEKILEENPVNTPIIKRRIALLRSMGRVAEAIGALVVFLEASPTDAEAWCELSDLYQSRGLMSQAVFSLEEALLIAPNAWNLHARLGEILYLAATASGAESTENIKLLSDSIKRFCRSIELCEHYVRGYYGLKIATQALLQMRTHTSSLPESKADTFRALNLLATQRLAGIIEIRSKERQSSGGVLGDVIVAKELLDRDSST